MWMEEYKASDKKVKYRFYEKYKDSMTGKKKRVSVLMNSKTKQSRKEAQRILDEKIKKIESSSQIEGFNTLTFKTAYDMWERHYKVNTKNKETTIKTYLTKGKILYKILDFDVLISKLNLPYLQNCFNKLSDYQYSNQTNRDVLSIFKKVMTYIKVNYGVSFPYLNDLSVPNRALTFDEIKSKKNNYLEQDQLKQILDELYVMKITANNIDNRRHYFFMYSIVEFLSLNGMRIGELLAIEEENIDLKNKKLTIDGTIQRKANSKGQYGVKDTTKNLNSYRTIDLTNRSCEILKACMLENKKATQWDSRYINRNFVFTNYRGNPIYFNRVNEALEKARTNLKIKKKITTHTLRHTHISLLTQMGISLKAIMDRVGHSDYRTTLGVYTHVTNQMKNELINKLENIEKKDIL
ncbi:tyrosine-type recombinase/integrase [Mammaliicoccus fleurettii]|uniref:tyrosine-type recombinase/integrase n=1 Tax=Mammaliicoccus fleurettii TaxID=150056 RepID=UPI002DB821FA|nr:site-specific integrase [Mammaliicoccus fleurettii]MEB7723442.1 site-specific integrase [Mammaliicoccus fleurettii]